jgi:hypothetical protein
MKCDNIKKLIHLNNNDELSETEKKVLKVHLSTCDSCKELMESLERTDALINKLKKVEPELTYPQVLTSNIMQSIKEQEQSSRYSFSIMAMFEMLFLNKVKILAYSIVIGLIGLFSYQQLSIMNKLNQMEKKIALKSDESVELKTAPLIMNNKVLKEFVSGIEDEQIVLDKRSLDRFIELYKDLKTDHNELLELLNDNIDNLEKKLSEKDIQKLKLLLKDDDLERKSSTNL